MPRKKKDGRAGKRRVRFPKTRESVTVFEVRKMCVAALAKNQYEITLIFPKGYGGCLFGDHGPKGDVIGENNKGEKLYSFDALRVLEYLRSNKDG
jgi:hypothetical protein